MLNPNSLKAKPADNYDDLKKQFFALKNLCESKIKQCSIYSNKLAEYDRESLIARNEALESEREMNAQLTEELAKANERVALLERVEKIFNESPELTFENVKVMFNDELNKFAIEKKIDGVQLVIDALASKGMLDTLTNFDINSVVEQLRKEQPSEQ